MEALRPVLRPEELALLAEAAHRPGLCMQVRDTWSRVFQGSNP